MSARADQAPPRWPRWTEQEFTRQVEALARLRGWAVYHTWLSVRSAPGFPDLVLVRAPRVVFAELKAAGGRTTAPQQTWLDELRACPGVETYLWFPADWEALTAVLT